MNVQAPAAPAAAADRGAGAGAKGQRIGSLTRRMIGVAALWIAALLLIGGFAVDRVMRSSITKPLTNSSSFCSIR